MTKDSPATAPAPPVRASRSIVTVLVSMALLSLVPAFVFSAVLIYRNNQAQLEVVRTLTASTVRSINSAIDREVDGMITTARLLSTTPSIDTDLRAFHNRTQTALRGTGSYLLLLDGSFQQLINTRVPYGTPLPKTADPAPAQAAIDNDRATISDFFMGAIADTLVFNVLLPRSTPQGKPQVVVITQNARNFQSALTSSQLPEGWNVALVDGKDTVAVSTGDIAEPGKKFVVPIVEARPPGWSHVVLNGAEYDLIVQQSFLTGWFVVAWAPQSVVSGPLMDTLLWLVAGAVLLGLVVAGGVAWLSSQIARAVRALAQDARRLGRGEKLSHRTYPVSELSDISADLAEAGRRRYEAETEVRFLMRELAHRAKNQLSVIQSMAKQTARSSAMPEDFLPDFQKRIMGLARSTDLLLNEGVSGVRLIELVETHVRPFAPEANRVRIGGDPVRLNAEAAQSLGMAVHEMATNAAKYGAFVGAEGELAVDWRWHGDRLVFDWRESGVGVAPGETRQGFGSTVIEKFMAATLDAKVEKLMHRDGIEWRLEMPAERILAFGAPPGKPS